MPRPTPGLPCVFAAKAAAFGNIAPPSASRWPVRMFNASTSTEFSVPKRCVLEPMREYTAARGVAAGRRARRRAGCRPARRSARPYGLAYTARSRTAACRGRCRRSRARSPRPARLHGKPLVEQDVDQAQQQEDVAARADEVMLVRHRRGLGAPRIDDDQPAAARAHRLRTSAEIRHRPHAAVAGHRVRAEHQQEVAAIDVGHRHAQRVAVHPAARELARHLVERRRAEQVARARGAQQALHVEPEAEPVHVRVAERERERVAAVFGDQRRQAGARSRHRPRPTTPARSGRRA